MSYVRTLTICLLLVHFVSATGVTALICLGSYGAGPQPQCHFVLPSFTLMFIKEAKTV